MWSLMFFLAFLWFSQGLKSYTPITSSLKSATSNCPTVTHFTPYHSNIISPGSPPPQVTIRGSSESSRRLDDAAAATHGRKKGKTKDVSHPKSLRTLHLIVSLTFFAQFLQTPVLGNLKYMFLSLWLLLQKDNKRESSFTVPLDKEFDLNEAIKFVEGESLEVILFSTFYRLIVFLRWCLQCVHTVRM